MVSWGVYCLFSVSVADCAHEFMSVPGKSPTVVHHSFLKPKCQGSAHMEIGM